jgi:8-oxo-dGTP diphosphatase/putative hydrolase of the HAD superfamily
MIKLIVFDLWNTLAFKDVPWSSTSKMLKKTQVNIPRDKFVKIYEKSVQLKKWDSKFKAYRNLCKNMGLETTEKNIKLLMDIRDEAEDKIKLFPHTLDMIKKLKKRGLKIGLISNTSIFAVEQLTQKTNLLEYIDYPLFSFDVGTIKPDARLFKEMLKIADCKPEEAVMIGDKMNDDVIPAKKLGMWAIYYKDYKNLKKELLKLGIDLD